MANRRAAMTSDESKFQQSHQEVFLSNELLKSSVLAKFEGAWSGLVKR